MFNNTALFSRVAMCAILDFTHKIFTEASAQGLLILYCSLAYPSLLQDMELELME